ncbi:hypothetical protein LTR78_001902 [Recurvomyces mirabilis]|uniref:Uncharacterized protein n=1 Tax=Recurvomyces mirabilis TaxID=574656 RepID=A0AAE1C5C7_9PEZI|nr:hypothetical protein LTR78_001902 [Recurvomyces mirabilis]KAK5156660.1 hypothetical protein LTS14_004872 [Recurvomyces mirabilis]
MPRKKSTVKATADGPKQKPEVKEEAKTTPKDYPKQEQEQGAEDKHAGQSDSKAKATNKRKKQASNDEPQKAARRSGRGAPKATPSKLQLLKYMLSKDAEALCRPDDETQHMKTRGNIKTYSSSVMNPYEELMCAIVLSRPISHRLGLRTIRTILNDPYNFTSARATKDSGSEKQHQALWDARTQHKDKTAAQIGELAEVVLQKFTTSNDKEGTEMQKVRDDCNRDVDKERQYLKDNIKGLGNTGLDIFFRRVQWLWDAGYPFVDNRTMQSLHKLGLPDEGEELHELIVQHWSELDTKVVTGSDEDMKKRRALVTVLERATGSDLEGKHEALLAAAAA